MQQLFENVEKKNVPYIVAFHLVFDSISLAQALKKGPSE